MLCEKCQERPATVLITKILNGQKMEKRLCDDCAHQENTFAIDLEPKILLQNFFADLFNSAHSGLDKLQVPAVKTINCERCAFTDADFVKTGKLGCPDCYAAFQGKIDPLLKRIHGANKHTGKLPQRTGGGIKTRQAIEQLKVELQQSIAKEEYEKAAELRDKIRGMEQKLKEGQANVD